MKNKKNRLLIYILILVISALSIAGCDDNNNPEDPNAPQTEAEANEPSENDNNNDDQNTPENNNPNDNTAPDATTPNNAAQPVAEKSPVAVSRINPEKKIYPQVSGTSADDSDAIPTDPNDMDPDDILNKDPHDHEPAPNLFPVDFCQVEVNGYYDSAFAKSLVDAINTARIDYMIGPVTRNTSLLACADIRCKEQSYFIGHFRPNGLPWNSVSYDYAQGECLAVDYRSADEVVEAWLSVNDTRIQLMNPDYTQIGTSVYNIDGDLYIAAIFGY